MIGLNKIWLNQVQLNRLYLNAPFPVYRKMTGGGSSGDGFPVLPGDVTRWHFGGLTNEMMAAMDDPRLEDADGKGRFLSFKNFLWAGMSGVGGYETYQSVYKFTFDLYANTCISKTRDHVNLTFKVTGLQPGNSLSLAYFGTTNTVYGTWTKDGVYTVNSKVTEVGKPLIFYNGYGSTRGEFTIEIFPLYPGALVFDGVDDYGICDNFPILTKEKGYTVVALRQYITRNEGPLGLVSNIENWFKDGAFLLEFREIAARQFNRSISFGAISKERDLPCVLTYQTSKSYNGVSIEAGNFTGTDVLHVGKLSPKLAGYCNAAIWELVFLDHDATEEELTKIKDYFVKTYPWLFPDQAWTVTGKTNEDEDRATIANITGNGNNLRLSNLGFIEGSGYNEEGEYAGYLVTDGVDDKMISSNFKFGENYTVVGEWEFLQEDSNIAAGFLKNPNYWGFFNYKDGTNALIKTDAQASFISGVHSIKASTSKGDIYPDFNSYVKIEPGKRIESQYTLNIAVNNTIFTKLAFKNLAIYSTVLSKEDCIKSYIYLQTLKAK